MQRVILLWSLIVSLVIPARSQDTGTPAQGSPFSQAKFVPDISLILDCSYLHRNISDEQTSGLFLPGFDGDYLDPISLGFALVAGAIIAFTTRRTDTHEAFIGLLYAFGLSAVFILLSKSPHGMETFQKLMASDILFTPLSEVLRTAGIYAVLGTILLLFYNRSSGLVKEGLFFYHVCGLR